MRLDLFSTPGEPLLHDLVDACRAELQRLTDPVVAYLPAAAVGSLWTEYTSEAFKGVADVRLIDLDGMTVAEIADVLDQASMLYIPGGNTFRLSHRLSLRGLTEDLKGRVRAGLHLASFSAGTVLCGQDILTTGDANDCGTTAFAGLALTGFNFHVHFPTQDGPERDARFERLRQTHARHPHPVLALEDGAHLRIRCEHIELVAGRCWRFNPGRTPIRLGLGPIT